MTKEEVNDKKLRAYLIERQFSIPPRLCSLANKYPTVSWLKVQQFYKICTMEVLNKYEIECLNDLSYGRGYVEVSSKFEKMLCEESNMNITNKQKFKICDLIMEKLNKEYIHKKQFEYLKKELIELHDKILYSLI